MMISASLHRRSLVSLADVLLLMVLQAILAISKSFPFRILRILRPVGPAIYLYLRLSFGKFRLFNYSRTFVNFEQGFAVWAKKFCFTSSKTVFAVIHFITFWAGDEEYLNHFSFLRYFFCLFPGQVILQI